MGDALRAVLESLLSALNGTPVAALAAAFALGVVSLVASPCHLASIPLIVAFLNRQGVATRTRAAVLSGSFAFGVFLTILLLAALASLAKETLFSRFGMYGMDCVALLLIVVGLHLFDVIPMPWSGTNVSSPRGGVMAAFSLGFVFGLAVGPCTVGFLGAALGMSLLYGGIICVVFGIGHCGMIALAGVFSEEVGAWLRWNERSRGALAMKFLCGSICIGAGLWLLATRG